MTDDMQREAFERRYNICDAQRYTNSQGTFYFHPSDEMRWDGWQAAIRHLTEQSEQRGSHE